MASSALLVDADQKAASEGARCPDAVGTGPWRSCHLLFTPLSHSPSTVPGFACVTSQQCLVEVTSLLRRGHKRPQLLSWANWRSPALCLPWVTGFGGSKLPHGTCHKQALGDLCGEELRLPTNEAMVRGELRAARGQVHEPGRNLRNFVQRPLPWLRA